MNKKNKNIIAIAIVIFLTVCLLVTFHLAKGKCYNQENEFYTVRPNGYIRKYNTIQNSEVDNDHKDLIPEEDIDEEEIDEEDIEESDEDDLNEDYYVNGRDSDKNKNSLYKSNNPIRRVDMPNRKTGISLGYAVLICFESILLGGAVMYLILNNMDILEEDNKLKKSKK